jgi:hypothetical protein
MPRIKESFWQMAVMESQLPVAAGQRQALSVFP